jgi:hypothetical protein
LRRYCLLQRVIEAKIKRGIEVTGRWGRRLTKLLDDLKDRRGYSHLKEEALDRTIWIARFGRGFRPVVRQTTKWMSGRNYIRHSFESVGVLKIGIVQSKLVNVEFKKKIAKYFGLMEK